MPTYRKHLISHQLRFERSWLQSRILMKAKQVPHFVWLFLLILSGVSSADTPPPSSTSLISEENHHLLILSTLDGSLIGVDSDTGHIRWKLKNEPAVKVSVHSPKPVAPLFLPDPKDGSLYVLGAAGSDALKKLPFTIPQLVASSPCRSSDGILYSGKKVDTWFSLDVKVGKQITLFSPDNEDPICPLGSDGDNPVFVGRSEFNIHMVDSKRRDRKWNITFYDYSSAPMDADSLSQYGLIHFMGTSSGRVLTVDRRVGDRKWTFDYGSPIIGAYIMNSEGFVSCPFTTVAEDTLDQLMTQLRKSPLDSWFVSGGMKLQPTLYVGEHLHGLYALPSLVDANVMMIEGQSDGVLLLEGPRTMPKEYESREDDFVSSSELEDLISLSESGSNGDSYPIILLGYYKMPRHSETQLQINGISRAVVPAGRFVYAQNISPDKVPDLINTSSPPQKSVAMQTGDFDGEVNGSCWRRGSIADLASAECLGELYNASGTWFIQQEHKALKFVLALIIISMAMLFIYVRGQMREFQQLSQGSRQGSNGSTESSITAHSIVSKDGGINVGKITFYTNQVLGKGCEGTFVYRGVFDGRSVAVKRLLPGCFSLADREVALLRESDQHANVVRYFCTEQDHLFRYIALELATATVADLVEGRVSDHTSSLPSSIEMMRQALMGLAHLHSLDIVHRDIKPHNVLLSMPNARGEVRAMISDFGLCKKLQTGRLSFSRRSGITGTDGWIAPEMLSGSARTTCAVDIFSMGCVLYYVKTRGKHPFGDPLRRQANILNGDYKLSEFGEPYSESVLVNTLVERMLSWEPLERPPAAAVLTHPLFWDPAKIMNFFQDVSDRVEKDEKETSECLQALENNGSLIVRTDWRIHICDDVAQDLRRYRNYRGQSVRDLLRALRNKKHHYRELSEEAQKSLGAVPEQFVYYWMSRFPRLLLHAWVSMQTARSEPIFERYYHPSFYFSDSKLDFPDDSVSGEDFNSVNWLVLERTDPPNSPKKSPSKSRKQPKTENWRERRRRDMGRSMGRGMGDHSPADDTNWRKKDLSQQNNVLTENDPADGLERKKTDALKEKEE